MAKANEEEIIGAEASINEIDAVRHLATTTPRILRQLTLVFWPPSLPAALVGLLCPRVTVFSSCSYGVFPLHVPNRQTRDARNGSRWGPRITGHLPFLSHFGLAPSCSAVPRGAFCCQLAWLGCLQQGDGGDVFKQRAFGGGEVEWDASRGHYGIP